MGQAVLEQRHLVSDALAVSTFDHAWMLVSDKAVNYSEKDLYLWSWAQSNIKGATTLSKTTLSKMVIMRHSAKEHNIKDLIVTLIKMKC
jgi:hypothetical protein